MLPTSTPIPSILPAPFSPGAEDKAFSLAYEIGAPFSGQTHFSLQGDGSYFLWSTVTEGRARLEFRGALALDEVHALLTKLSQSRFWERCSDEKTKVPDDVKARISIRDEEDEQVAAVWLSQMDDCPGFRAAQDALLAWVAKISEGKILEKGR